MFKLIFALLMMATILSAQTGDLPTDGLVGHWTFDNASNLEEAMVGEVLVRDTVTVDADINGFLPVSGPEEGNGAVQVLLGSFYRCSHNIFPNGFDPAYPDSTSSRVNQYSLVIDFHIPATGVWYTFHATDNDGDPTDSDWESFIRSEGNLGVGTTGYSFHKVTDTEGWYRLIIVADLGVQYTYYLDGKFLRDGSPRSIDDRLSLDSPLNSNSIMFFGDNDGEDAPIDIAELALYDRPLTIEEIEDLGGYGHFIEVGEPVGLWDFNDSENLTAATTGQDLNLVGNHTSVEGPYESDGAAQIGVASYYEANHNMVARGFDEGATKVNRYTISMDVMIPALGIPYALYQADAMNSSDAELFINAEGKIGSPVLGWTDSAYVKQGEWYRASLAISLGDTIINAILYLDGEKVLEKQTLPTDGDYALSPISADNKVLFFADDNGEDNELAVAAVSIYNRPLSEDDLEGLGGYEHVFSTEITPAGKTLEYLISAQIQSTQYVRVPYSDDFDIRSERSFTVEVWLKIGTGIDSDPAFVSNKDWDSGNNNGWNMAAKDNSWDLNFADTTRLDIDFDLENIYDNFWHHVGFSLDRSAPGVTNDSITVFTDNRFLGPFLFAENFVPGREIGPVVNEEHNPLVFAQDGTEAYPDKYPGKIDEVRIWHEALDNETIKEWRHKDITSDHPYYEHLVGHWKFDEGEGTTIHDLSGNGHHGEIVGSPLPNWKVSYVPMGDTHMENMQNVSAIWGGEAENTSGEVYVTSDFSDLSDEKLFISEMYTIIGHDGKTDATESDLGGILQARFRRVWYYDASETFTKSMDITFTLTQDAGDESGYFLLTRSQAEGVFEAAAVSAVVTGPEIKFAGAQLDNGTYFTLGTSDVTGSPLGYPTGIGDIINPYTYYLKNNYPNPFNPLTTIEYSLAKKTNVTLKIYNVIGQEVARILDNVNQPAGPYKIQWSAESLSSGIYFYRIEAGDFRKTHKMLLLK